MSLVVSNRISDTEFEVQLARPEYMVDYEARSYIVAVKDGGDFISCNCGYFQHIGMLCRHSIKILIQKDIFKIPINNIVKRWTRRAKEGFEGVHIPSQSSRATDDSAARQNILYIAAMEAVKEVSQCESMLETTLKVFRELTSEAIRLRECDGSSAPRRKKDDGLNITVLSDKQISIMHTPKRVKPKGRPKILRVKSRLEYVKVFKQKNKSVATLYGNKNIQPSDFVGHSSGVTMEDAGCPNVKKSKTGKRKTPSTSRSSCKMR
ncbi:uncharacterized protein [Triticum aestivum]|uniref:uncharacterized protein n=1 Tax=Triticum aestivum TaxID=4565 RepID=UPI001D0068AD|nr:uncharacterized protein LOC123084545 [Triticum aestivum]